MESYKKRGGGSLGGGGGEATENREEIVLQTSERCRRRDGSYSVDSY